MEVENGLIEISFHRTVMHVDVLCIHVECIWKVVGQKSEFVFNQIRGKKLCCVSVFKLVHCEDLKLKAKPIQYTDLGKCSDESH